MMNFTASQSRSHSAEMPDLNEFMITKEAAKKLGFNVRTIPDMMKDNELEGMRYGRAWLVSKKSVEDYLKRLRAWAKTIQDERP